MYVREKALTFADLSKAVQASAGLGQIDASTLPLTSSADDSANVFSLSNVASQIPSMPWGTLALIVGGLFLFSIVEDFIGFGTAIGGKK